MVDLLTREYEVNYSHIDNRGIAKPSFLWNIMQDAATVHAEALHIGPLDLRIVWVLSRMKARLTRPLLPYERLRCETWCPGIKGASWYRSFSFFVDNKPVGDAQSMWVTLDPETHRIVRPSAFPEAEHTCTPPAESCLHRCPSCRVTTCACIMFTRSVIRIWMSTIMSTTCVRSS